MYQIAQVNIARMIAPLKNPVMADFVARLDEVNALADRSPGFIWRLQTEDGDATAVQAFDDELILFNMSVWASLSELTQYVYASESMHRDVMKQRRRWFQRYDGPFVVLWWIPGGHIPDVAEAKERLAYLREHGETSYAFGFKKSFPAPGTSDIQSLPVYEDCSSGH